MDACSRSSRWVGKSLAMAVVLAFGGEPLGAQVPVVGQVKNVAGSAVVVRNGQEMPVTAGLALRESDSLRTGTDGSLGLTLRDGTRVSLGPDTRLHLASYAFAPAENQLALTLRLLRGTLAYISGRIAHLAPSAVTIETPTSVIGVRGTHVLVSAG
jgi:hypothetical protein